MAVYKITTVSQLDQFINGGGILIADDILSPEMQQAMDLYALSTRAMLDEDYQYAVDIYRSMLIRWPSFVAPRINLANCLNQLGFSSQALRELTEAHKHAPSDPDIHLCAARIYESCGDQFRELQEYLQAHNDYSHPYNIDILFAIGVTYFQIKQNSQAKAWLEKALEAVDIQDAFGVPLGRTHVEERFKVLNWLALTCQEMGLWQEAVQRWEQCLILDPTSHQLKHLLSAARRKTYGK